MLVLTRKKSELIRIGNEIVVKVISAGRGKVKLGIDAPAHIRVLRGELAGTVGRQQSNGPESPADKPQILA